MVDAARLALNLAMPTESAGSNRTPLPSRDEVWARNLFERAVGGFYRVNLRSEGWAVATGKTFKWQTESATDGIAAILPRMKADIVLDHAATGRRVIVDTKFNEIVAKGWYRPRSLRSGYLYQMYAYMRSQAGSDTEVGVRTDGLLLHPAVGETVDESVTIQGHRLRFATVDLAGTPASIRDELLRVIEPS